ncbi:MAG: oligoendopeptidase F [Clostridiales Family XIII bacterium]|jgi:oligoendopeptidase F|nr:oligoendopeptidase F [Clostridiales Family XIII bacterium]
MKQNKLRGQIPEQYKWDLGSLYPGDEGWEKDFGEAGRILEGCVAYSGRLGEGAGILLEALEAKDRLWRSAERLYVYARMRKDEDNRDARYQAMLDRIQAFMAKASAGLSFFTPEFIEIPEERLAGFMEAEAGLGRYRHYIDVLLREKAHVLSEPEENLLAQLSEVTGATGDIFGMINNADMKFGHIIDEDGEEAELTHGKYIAFMESRDREVRKSAFTKMHGAYAALRNTLAATYSYNTKYDVVSARIRKYPSSLEAALSGDNIPVAVYDSLVEAVNGRLGTLHRYLALRQKIMGLDKLHLYDVYAPLFNIEQEPIPYEGAVSMMKRGLAALGEEYVETAARGIRDRWIDVYENEGKTSGAYSFGSYDSNPYILMNYSSKLKDVFTLAHEMGHSMHSWYTRRSQPFIYGSHSIFTAEVASTVNESLLMRHLVSEEGDPERKKYLLGMHIEEFRTTLFRQTMFAEFERLTHEAVERGEALTADRLSEDYYALNRKYFGPDTALDEEIAAEWARIPHFYRAFYVYKYATGYSAATAISKGILEGGAPAAEAYISFLKTGESDDPIELLKIAGVDMSRPEPVLSALDTFEGLVSELEELV